MKGYIIGPVKVALTYLFGFFFHAGPIKKTPITIKAGNHGTTVGVGTETLPLFEHTPHISPNSRGLIGLAPKNCTGCSKCALACPNKCIEMTPVDPPIYTWELQARAKGKEPRPLKFPEIYFGRCMFCGLCTEACPFEALFHTPLYETSVTTDEKSGMHYTWQAMEQVLKEGNPELYQKIEDKWKKLIPELEAKAAELEKAKTPEN